jgi:DNA polymerase-3 subunit epsilon
MPTLPEKIVFVDLETTGATARVDRITEIGIVEVDASGVREWSCLVNPETPISTFIERLTGISNAMVAAAPTFAELADEVRGRLEGRLFVAHNARFDYGFLKNEFRRAGLDFRATVLCTVKLSRRLFPQHHKHSLDALIERHGLAVGSGQRHRALGDAQLIHQFWRQLHDLVAPDELDAVLKALLARPRLPPQLDASILDDLPEAPGVYLFYGENELPLYIGKSKDIRKRVLAHFAADHSSSKKMDLVAQVRRIDWMETAGDIGAQLREAALIKRLQPTHNRARQRRVDDDALCAWPFAGPAMLREGDEAHIVDRWCYLGTAKSENEIWEILESAQPRFDRDTYRLLHKAVGRMRPVRVS